MTKPPDCMKPHTIRMSQRTLDRAAELAPVMALDPDVSVYGIPSRSTVLRLAVVEGLKALEARYQQEDGA